MSRLLLLRHAKAAWAEPGLRDFDRSLTAEGGREAVAVGRYMVANGLVPARVICSPAKRAVETWHGVAGPLGRNPGEALFSEALYASDASGYLAVLRNVGGSEPLLLIGHNPMIEDLAVTLSAHGGEDARARLAKGFPTAGLAVIAFPAPLSEAAMESASLEVFVIPADI